MTTKFIAAIASATIACIGIALAATPAQRAAVSAVVSYERTHDHNTDVEQPACTILQGWAHCMFGSDAGDSEVSAWLHLKNGAWKVLGTSGGVTTAADLEAWYHMPPSIARALQTRRR